MSETTGGPGSAGPPPIHDKQYDVLVYSATCAEPVALDILVPMHGNLHLTRQCLDSLYACAQARFHLLAMDDAPPGDEGQTAAYIHELRRKYDNITYCHSNIPWKCGSTFFNVGLRYARTEYFATIMNSCTVEPNWEMPALELLKKDPKIGTVGFKCLFPNGLIESAGIAFAGHIPTDIGRDMPGFRMNETREVIAAQWAAALHRKAALVGNLDENVFHGHVGWDDIDYSFVLRSKGWKIVYCGQCNVIHRPRSTRGSGSNEAAVKNQQNARTFFKRWGFWKQYLEGTKMDVGAILKYDTKAKLTETVTKIQVLRHFLSLCEKEMQGLANEALAELKVSPDQYQLEMNPQTNTWLLKPNGQYIMAQQGVIATPTMPMEPLPKPAGDTQPEPGVLEGALPGAG